ncbi:Hypothetical Protein RSKD131_2955 [Cereibacter sphaeroides KD131]|nr:Hypothetical Protein RSKD131_2955 [Cereibacter sphaeroides KD131]
MQRYTGSARRPVEIAPRESAHMRPEALLPRRSGSGSPILGGRVLSENSSFGWRAAAGPSRPRALQSAGARTLQAAKPKPRGAEAAPPVLACTTLP